MGDNLPGAFRCPTVEATVAKMFTRGGVAPVEASKVLSALGEGFECADVERKDALDRLIQETGEFRNFFRSFVEYLHNDKLAKAYEEQIKKYKEIQRENKPYLGYRNPF